MSEKRGGPAEKITKDCFVVLNRLDEKLLNRYLRKNSRNKSSQKRKKVKPLCYTDDETDSVEREPLKRRSKNVRSADLDSQTMKDVKLEAKEMGCEVVRTGEGRKQLPVENGDSCCDRTGYCSPVDSEIEIIKEVARSFVGNVICDKAACDVKINTQNEIKHPELDDLDVSRDDGEDDRSTVIFEKDTYLEEIFESDEKEISKKFKKKKITNRKKQRLVKFKRKSMTGRKLGKIRKGKSKLCESGNGGQDTAEKSQSDCIAEGSLSEVCVLVRRLHEMYTIIMQLQREMPKDSELAFHFKRVISAQQENFHSEIRKTQKIIIKSFEKMLKSSSNTLEKVALDIGKRAHLTADEVVYVLSLCILSEGSCDVDRNRSGSVEKIEQSKSSSSLRKVRIAKKATQSKLCKSNAPLQEIVNAEVSSVAPPSQTTVPPVVANQHSGLAEQQAPPVALVPNSRGQVPKSCPQPFNYYQLEKPNQRSHFLAPQNFENTRINSEVRQFREMNPQQAARQSVPSTQPPSTMSLCFNVPYTNLYVPRPRPPPPSYTAHTTMGHYQRSGNVPQVPGRISGLPFLVASHRQSNYVPVKPNANQTFGSQVLMQNRCGAVPNRISQSNHPCGLSSVTTVTRRNGAFPAPENVHCSLVNGEIILTPTSDFTDPVGYYNAAAEKTVHERLTIPVDVGDSNTETNPPGNTNSEVPEVLDPTIPQKLTMKNCRLQAGPILGSVRSPPEGKTKCTGSENSDQEHSRSRTYICAENGCKNRGVRICNFCQSVIYCSETCQQKHWNLKHKSECCQLKELRG